jgi:hypothetical protein
MGDWFDVEWDTDTMACLRSCLMKPEHEAWVARVWELLDQATDRALAGSRRKDADDA